MTNPIQFNNEKYDNLLKDLTFTKEKNNCFMSNEYFRIIRDLVESDNLKSVHAGFAYSYMYLQTYMYRYATYNNYVPSVAQIKELFNYNPKKQVLDYIIKKDGLLDDVGLTTTEGFEKKEVNFPILVEMKDKEPVFTLAHELDVEGEFLNQWKKKVKVTNRSTLKKPVLAFHSNVEDKDFMGTFFHAEDFTNVPFEVLAFCLSHDNLGADAFYVYSYIKHKNDIHDDYTATHKVIARELGLKERKTYDIMVALREHNLVSLYYNMEFFSVAIAKEERKASSLTVNEYVNSFSIEKLDLKKIKVVSEKKYKQMQSDKNYSIDESQLPF